MLRKHLVLTAFLFTSGFAFGSSADITLDSLANICQTQEKAIQDVTAEYEFSVVPLPTLNQVLEQGGSAVLNGPKKFLVGGKTLHKTVQILLRFFDNGQKRQQQEHPYLTVIQRRNRKKLPARWLARQTSGWNNNEQKKFYAPVR